jgi:hypothetical protein
LRARLLVSHVFFLIDNFAKPITIFPLPTMQVAFVSPGGTGLGFAVVESRTTVGTLCRVAAAQTGIPADQIHLSIGSQSLSTASWQVGDFVRPGAQGQEVVVMDGRAEDGVEAEIEADPGSLGSTCGSASTSHAPFSSDLRHSREKALLAELAEQGSLTRMLEERIIELTVENQQLRAERRHPGAGSPDASSLLLSPLSAHFSAEWAEACANSEIASLRGELASLRAKAIAKASTPDLLISFLKDRVDGQEREIEALRTRCTTLTKRIHKEVAKNVIQSMMNKTKLELSTPSLFL